MLAYSVRDQGRETDQFPDNLCLPRGTIRGIKVAPRRLLRFPQWGTSHAVFPRGKVQCQLRPNVNLPFTRRKKPWGFLHEGTSFASSGGVHGSGRCSLGRKCRMGMAVGFAHRQRCTLVYPCVAKSRHRHAYFRLGSRVSLSKFDPKEYADMLVRSRAQSIVCYCQSHVGLFNYPTKVGKQHAAPLAAT